MTNQTPLCSVEEAIDDVRAGKIIIIVDSPSRENEGDMFIPAQCATEDNINFMIRHARGLMCAPVSRDLAQKLDLPLMLQEKYNTDAHSTAFTISVDKRGSGVSTGISAYDRMQTLKSLADPQTSPSDLRRPGHIFPLIAKDGGVVERAGHTEAAVELCKLAGFAPAGVIDEILNEDGTMARMDDLVSLAAKFDLKIVSIEDMIAYKNKH